MKTRPVFYVLKILFIWNLILFGILFGWILWIIEGPGVDSYPKEARREATYSRLRQIKSVLNVYYSEYGVLPLDNAGFLQVIEWGGLSGERDLWGNNGFVYERTGSDKFIVCSKGGDHLLGTPDDFYVRDDSEPVMGKVTVTGKAYLTGGTPGNL